MVPTKKKAAGPRQVNLPPPKGWTPRADLIVPIGSAAGMNGHAGEVMGSPRVRAVYWGNAYGSQAGGLNQVGQSLDNFFSSMFPTSYFGFLSEYSVGTPSFLGSVWLPHDSTQTLTLSKDDMKTRVIAWLDGGLLPEVPGRTEKNLLYMIFLSPEMTLSDTSNCGYHDWTFYHKGSGKHNLFFAIITSDRLPAQIQTASHELVEGFTDRSGNGWYADNGMEIGDICDGCSSPVVTLNGITLASYWRNSVGNCLQQTDLTPPPPRLQPNVDVNPYPVPLNTSTTFEVRPSDPNTGADVNGQVEVQDPRANGSYTTIAQFPAPGTSPQLTLHVVTLRTHPEPTVLYPSARFTPSDLTHYQPVDFDIAGG